MSDLISRQDAIDALDKRFASIPIEQTTEILQARRDLRGLPSAEPNLIIHCADCRWWKQDEDIAPYGWCFACRSESYTEHWNITIRRKYKGDFFCADAEPRIEGEDDDE